MAILINNSRDLLHLDCFFNGCASTTVAETHILHQLILGLRQGVAQRVWGVVEDKAKK